MADRGGDETRERMQVKSFTTWVNLHLGREGMEVQDLTKDLADGIKLIKLIEVISEENLGKFNPKPITKFQKVENLNISLKYINEFIKSQGIKNQYSAENVLEENKTLILGMIYSLIMRFAVQQVSEGDRTAKEGLLLWAQKKVEEGSKAPCPDPFGSPSRVPSTNAADPCSAMQLSSPAAKPAGLNPRG